MMLVLGGVASGKRTYVRSLGYADEQMSPNVEADAPVLYELSEALRTTVADGRALEALRAKEVIVCCEVGMGVVPVDGDERAWRELVGRTCAQLARNATKVVRMVCGIPVTIKDGAEGKGVAS